MPGNDITFTANATGTELSYQWTKGSSNLIGETQSTYTVTNAQTDDHDIYSCIIKNNCRTVQLASFTLNVNTPPTTIDTIIRINL